MYIIVFFGLVMENCISSFILDCKYIKPGKVFAYKTLIIEVEYRCYLLLLFALLY